MGLILESKKIKFNSNTLAIILIVLSSFTMLNWMNGYLFAEWDHLYTPFYPESSLSRDAYVWGYPGLGGQYFPTKQFLVQDLVYYFLNLILPIGMVHTVVMWLLFLCCGITMYIFSIKSIKIDSKIKPYISLIIALCYMFNPYWTFVLDREPLPIYIMAFLPLLLLISKELIDSSSLSISRTIKYSFVVSLITLPMSPGLGEFPAGLMAVFFIGVYLLFFSIEKHKIKQLFLYIPFVLSFIFLVNLFWIGPTLYHPSIKDALTRGTTYVEWSLGILKTYQPWTTCINVFRNMGYVFPPSSFTGLAPIELPPDYQFYKTDLSILISFFPLLIGSIALLSKKIRHSSDIMSFAITLLFLIPMLCGLNPPFGSIIEWFLRNIPIYAFRRLSVLMFPLTFIYAYMFGLGIFAIYQFISNIKHLLINFLKGFFIIITMLIIFIQPFPQWLGHPTELYLHDIDGNIKITSTRVEIPEYVKNLIDYIKNSPEKGGVLILPLLSNIRGYAWEHGYFGYDVYYLSLDNPVITNYFSGSEELTRDKIYKFVNDYIYTSKSEIGIANLLTLLNIKYIIVVEDSLKWTYSDSDIAIYHKQLSDIYYINQVGRFDKHVLYENTKNLQMFYSITHSIYNESNSISGVLLSLLNQDDPIKIAYVDSHNTVISYNEDPPTVIYDELNPTHFKVHVLNATIPFILVSTLSYDTNWIAQIDDSQIIQTKINSIFNGWLINKTGSYTIDIYYLPQVYAQIFEYISVFFIIIAIIYITTKSSLQLLFIPIHKVLYKKKLNGDQL